MSNEDLTMLIKQNADNKERSKEHLEELYTNNLPIIRKIANKYKAYAEIEDLLQEGFCGLYMAVQHYEIEKDIKFITYATYWIEQSMKRYMENCCQSVRIPVHMLSDISKYKKVLDKYRREQNRNPNDIEICDCMKCSIEKLGVIKKAYNQQNIKSLDEEIENDTGDTVTLMETLAGNDDIENSVIENEMHEKMKSELWQIVHDSLIEAENDVIVEKYRYNKSNREIAENRGSTVSKITTLESKALKKLNGSRIRKTLENKFEIVTSIAFKGCMMSDSIMYSSTERAVFKDMGIRI